MTERKLTLKPAHGRLPTTAVSRDLLDALDALSSATGLAKTYLIRSVLEQHLHSVGLLDSLDSVPTKRKSHE